MRPIKMLGLAALALMAMALVGTSSAMAENTALCKVMAGAGADEGCTAGNLASHVHEATVAGAPAKLLTTILTVECAFLFLGDVTSTGLVGNPLEISGHFTYSSCTAGCEATEVSTSALIKALKIGHELAEVKGTAEVLLKCGKAIHCVYNGTGIVGHGLGPLLSTKTNGDVTVTEQTLNRVSGTLCPATLKLDITTTGLEALYITLATAAPPAENTALCKVMAGVGADEGCTTGNLASHVHEATVAGAPAKLLTSVLTVECAALFLGDVTNATLLGDPLEISGHFTYSSCTTGCEATEVSTSALIKALKKGHELAEVKGIAEVLVKCGKVLHCVYNGTGIVGHGLGPLLSTKTNGDVTVTEQTVNHVSGTLCPATSKLDIVTTPLEALYITL